MNTHKVFTALSGYDGPIFPDLIDKLNELAASSNLSGVILQKIGKNIEGFIAKRNSITDDGYWWSWSLHFKTAEGKIAVLFPWPWGQQFDRSIAFYTIGKVDFNEIDHLVLELFAEIGSL